MGPKPDTTDTVSPSLTKLHSENTKSLSNGETEMMLLEKDPKQTTFSDFDAFLDYIGPLGRFFRFVIPLIWLISIPFGLHMVAMVFLAYEPDFQCRPIDLTTNGSIVHPQVAAPVCPKENSTCDKIEFDQKVMTSTITTEWLLVCDRQWLQAQSQSLYMVGFMIGCFLFGELSDRFGRLRMTLICTVFQVAAGVGVAFAPSIIVFTLLRIMVAAFTAGQKNSSYVLCMEFVSPRYRELVSVFNEPFFTAGYLLVGLSAYATRDWKETQLIISLPALIFLIYYWLLPESPRWLLTKNKTSQALRTARKMAAWNKVKMPENFSIAYTDKKQSGKIQDLFRTRRLVIRTMLLLYIWFVNSFVFYGLAFLSTSLAGDAYVNFVISGLVELPGYFLVMLLARIIGRRFTLCVGLGLAGVSCVVSAYIPSHMWPVAVTLTMIGKMIIAGTLALMYMYTSELYPTSIRNLAVGTGNMVSKLGATLTPFVAMLDIYYKPLPIIIFGATSAVAGVIMFFLPETKGHSLPDTFEEANKLGQKLPNGVSIHLEEKPV